MLKIGFGIFLFWILLSNPHVTRSAVPGNIQLELNAIWNGKEWLTSYQGNSIQLDYKYDQFHVVFDKDSLKYKLYRHGNKQEGKESREVAWEEVTSIQVNIVNEGNSRCPKEEFQFSSLKYFDNVPLTNLKELTFNYSNFGCRLSLDLEKADWFKSILKYSRLKSFKLLGRQAPEFCLTSIQSLPIEELWLPKPYGDELLLMDSVKYIRMNGPRSAFVHKVSQMPSLVLLEDNTDQFYNRFHSEHAERYFFLRSTNALHSPLMYPIDLESCTNLSPFTRLIKIYQDSFPEKWIHKGDFVSYEDDLVWFTKGRGAGDTLLAGKVRHGVPDGIWTFRIEEQYVYRDEESFHIDVDSEPFIMPQNGICNLTYVNGNTAIQGMMKEGGKVGEWLFYKETGALTCKKYFELDQLKRTVVYFYMRDNPLESRTYYISPNASIHSFLNNGKVSFMYLDQWTHEKDVMIINENSISLLQEDGNYLIYHRSDPNFETILRETVIDKVYPEFIGKELPFTF